MVPDNMEYSTDGKTWIEIAINETTPEFSEGEYVAFKSIDYVCSIFKGGIPTSFVINKPYSLRGNCMSLVYGDNAKGQTALTQPGQFAALFAGPALAAELGIPIDAASVVDIDPGFLPATELTESCYYLMFGMNALMTSAPVLPAYTLVPECYSMMFMMCSSLNYVKMLAVEYTEEAGTFGSTALSSWLAMTAESGTFVKHEDNNWIEGLDQWDSVPAGWDIETATE